jgi:arylsulfatase A-like enzyme
MLHRAFVAASLAALAVLSCEQPKAPRVRPNVVLIVVDTLRADHADSERGKASVPAFDAFAKDAIAFDHAFSHAPATLPSHAALFSARPVHETGVRTNGQPVPKDLGLFADWIARHGYATQAAVSLASMWPADGGRGVDRGFQRYDRDRWSHTRGDDLDRSLAASLDQLSADQPFFLFAHYSDPHEPYDAHGSVERFASLRFDGRDFGTVCTSETAQVERDFSLPPGKHVLDVRSQQAFKVRELEFTAPGVEITWEAREGKLHERTNAFVAELINPGPGTVTATFRTWLHDAVGDEEVPLRYRSEVEFADRAVGNFIAELKRRGLYDSSIIVLTSDHGESLGDHGTFGHIVDLYDELLHVPLIVRLPSSLSGREMLEASSRRLVRLIDVAPTLLQLMELPPLPEQRGVSLLDPKQERMLVAQTQRADGTGELFCVRDDQFKLIYSPADDRFEMYDVVKDPLELGDVYATAARERPDWAELLRSIAARTRRDGARQVDPEARKRLQELGY